MFSSINTVLIMEITQYRYQHFLTPDAFLRKTMTECHASPYHRVPKMLPGDEKYVAAKYYADYGNRVVDKPSIGGPRLCGTQCEDPYRRSRMFMVRTANQY